MELEKLINDKEILYIYEIGLQVYGLFEGVEDRDFLLIVSDNFISTPELQDDEHYQIINIKDWFDYVTNNRMLAWECACLPKKFIHKEHVKLLLQTNPLQLRKEYDELYKYDYAKAQTYILKDYPLSGQKTLWELVKYLKFANQIIENHKIVNFKEVAEDYRQIVNGQIFGWDEISDVFFERLQSPLKRFKEYTDGMLRQEKLKKFLENGN